MNVAEGKLEECGGIVSPGFFFHEILQTDVERVGSVGFPEQKRGVMLYLKFGKPSERKIKDSFGFVYHTDMNAVGDEP